MSKENLLSSAEMTAYWRSKEPSLSGDSLSVKLATSQGIAMAHHFDQEVYPHTTRLLTVRNRYFESRVLNLLATDRHDAVISLGSGLSLLLYYIALKADGKISFYDSDVFELIKVRNERIQKILSDFDQEVIQRISTFHFDCETAYESGKSFKEMMPVCQSPIIVMEGLTYFLTENCLKWIFEATKQYNSVSFVFDYWPDYAQMASDGYGKASHFLKNKSTESLKTLLSNQDLLSLIGPAILKEDGEVKEYESEFVDEPLMNQKQNSWPARFAVVEKM